MTMKTYLLCNVGTRDVEVAADVQFENQQAFFREKLVPRVAGKEILERELFQYVNIPIIEQAMRYVQRNQPETMLSIVLFTTDQPDSVADRYRNSDTVYFAGIIKRLLIDVHGFTKERIFVHSTSQDPSDYDKMHEWYTQIMGTVAQRIDAGAPVYLLLAGGTPAMNTMLLFAGSERFQAAARPIYVSPARKSASELDINRQISRTALLRSLREVLVAYAYSPAQALVKQHPALKAEEDNLLNLLFEYAQQRRHFKFDAAIQSLDRALKLKRMDQLEWLRDDLIDHNELFCLREVIYLAEIALQTGDWLDFLTRLHRFSEGLLQLLAERVGVEWSDKKERKSYHKRWWEAQRSVLHQLGLTDAAPADQKIENKRREVDRKNLDAVVAHFIQQQGLVEGEQILSLLQAIDAVVPLRNQIVHRFTPVTRAEIEAKKHTPEVLIEHMRQAFALFTAEPSLADQNPYEILNQTCLRLFDRNTP